MTKAKQRVRRSVKLSADDLSKLTAKLDTFDTHEDAAEYFGVERVTLYRIASIGSGKSTNVNKILVKL